MIGDRDREDAAVLAGDGAGGGSPRGGVLIGTAAATAASAGLGGGTTAKARSPFDIGRSPETAGGGAELAGVAAVAAAVDTAATAAGGSGFTRSLTEATGAEPVVDGEACWAAWGAPAVVELTFPRAAVSCSDRRSSSAFFDLAAASFAAFALAFTAARLCSNMDIANKCDRNPQGRKGARKGGRCPVMKATMT